MQTVNRLAFLATMVLILAVLLFASTQVNANVRETPACLESHTLGAERTEDVQSDACSTAVPAAKHVPAAHEPGTTASSLVAGSEHWDDQFAVPGVNSTVFTLAQAPDGTLYAGGWFTEAGGMKTNYVAQWNGTDWQPLGDGLGGVSTFFGTTVRALAVGNDGTLYAGGQFGTAGDETAHFIAQWDGTNWSDVGGGMGGSGAFVAVHAFAVDQNGDLYVGGNFTEAGDVTAPYVARWDGTQWHALGSGVNGPVYALAIGDDGTLYAGGEFSSAGGTPAHSVAAWDGTEWSVLGDGVTADVGTAQVNAIAVDEVNGGLYVGGYLTTAGTEPANNIAYWNGTAWESLGSGIDSDAAQPVQALTLDETTGTLSVGGAFTTAGGTAANYLATWNGSTWSALPGEPDDEVAALLLETDGSLVAGGDFETAGGAVVNHIARWNGSAWSTIGDGHGMTDWVLALSSDGSSLYAGGLFTGAGETPANGIARWTGKGWSDLAGGVTNGTSDASVSALAIDGDGTLYAGGDFTMAGGTSAQHVARWDGNSWSAVGSGMDDAVYALAHGPDGTLYAGGRFTTAGGVTANHVARWDGSAWQPLGDGMGGGDYTTVLALTVDDNGTLYAGGTFTTAGTTTASYIARWDGSRWHAVGGGMDDTVSALAVGTDGTLYAGGDFTTAGGITVNHVARWDGTSWSSLNRGTTANVSVGALAVANDGLLYVGGFFDTAGDVTARSIAAWDGTSWCALGDGLISGVYAIAPDTPYGLFAGGSLFKAGEIPSANIARWGLTSDPPDVSAEHAVYLPIVIGSTGAEGC